MVIVMVMVIMAMIMTMMMVLNKVRSKNPHHFYLGDYGCYIQELVCIKYHTHIVALTVGKTLGVLLEINLTLDVNKVG